MTVQAYDSLIGTNGTLLTAHTAPGGQTWAMHSITGQITDNTAPTLSGSGAAVGASGSGVNLALFGATPVSADYGAQCQYADTSLPGTQNTRLWVRADPTANTGYYVCLDARGSGAYRLDLYKNVAGVETYLGSSATNVTLTGTDALYLKIEASGTTITGSFQLASAIAGSGWIATPITDSAITAAGKSGFTVRSGNGEAISDFRVQDVGTAYNAALPSSFTVSPTSVVAGSAVTVTATGTGTAWTSGTTFSATVGTISALSVNVGTQVATFTYTAPATAQTITISDSTDSDTATLTVVAAATSYTLTGPTSGFTGVASSAFTVALTPGGGAVTGTVTVTPSDGGGGGTFAPSTVNLTTGSPSATFTYTAASTGAKTISATNNASNPTLTNPSSLTYTVSNPNVLQLGVLTATPTYNSIAFELLYTGDANANSTITAQFKKHADSTWRTCLPPVRVWKDDATSTPITPTAWYWSVLLCTSGTSYDYQVTVADADGVAGPTTLSGTISTVADSIPDPITLTPDHYLDPVSGSDAAAGTSAGTAWKTLDYTLTNAPSGAVVQTLPGLLYLDRFSPVRTTPLTLVAQYPAVTPTTVTVSGKSFTVMVPANDGNRTVVVQKNSAGTGPVYTSPTGSGDLNPGIWSQVVLLGPKTGANHTVWKAVLGSQIAGANLLCFSTTKTSESLQVATWPTAPTLQGGWGYTGPANWAEMVYTNQTYNYGAYYDPNSTNQGDCYLRLPGDVDPNTVYLWPSGSISQGEYGLSLNAANCRVSGLEFRAIAIGVFLQDNAGGSVADHLYCHGNWTGAFFSVNTPLTALPTQAPVTIEYCYLKQSNLWASPPTTATIPWIAFKSYAVAQDGTLVYGHIGIGDTGAIMLNSGANWPQVVRYNTIEGWPDGFSDLQNNTGRYTAYAFDFHDNYVYGCADDSIEVDTFRINTRIWNNYLAYTLTGASLYNTTYGPAYFFRNLCWRTGATGQGVNMGGTASSGVGTPLPGGTLVKMGSTSSPYPWIYLVHNTFWSDVSFDVTPNDSVPFLANCDGPYFEQGQATRVYARNNIMRCTSSDATWWAANSSGLTDWTIEDHNQYGSSGPSPTVKIGNNTYSTLAALQTAGYGSGDQPYLGDGTFATVIDSQLTSPTTGDLRLTGSALQDAGALIPNLSEIAVVNDGDLSNGGYYGAAPDLGAMEYAPSGGGILAPLRTLLGVGQ